MEDGHEFAMLNVIPLNVKAGVGVHVGKLAVMFHEYPLAAYENDPVTSDGLTDSPGTGVHVGPPLGVTVADQLDAEV